MERISGSIVIKHFRTLTTFLSFEGQKVKKDDNITTTEKKATQINKQHVEKQTSRPQQAEKRSVH